MKSFLAEVDVICLIGESFKCKEAFILFFDKQKKKKRKKEKRRHAHTLRNEIDQRVIDKTKTQTNQFQNKTKKTKKKEISMCSTFIIHLEKCRQIMMNISRPYHKEEEKKREKKNWNRSLHQ
jgi:hypothetical protein